ncbi:MAG: hypothetical protein LBF85_01580 [Tannerella sp.]|nr:hypothetical protein [Tannerella sp.]
MGRELFPRTVAGFAEYIKIAYRKVSDNLDAYGIPPAKLSPITPLYEEYVAWETLAANPDTATKGNRRARDTAHKALDKAWRHFLNENIRYNTQISVSDLAVFGIRPRDSVRATALVPVETGLARVKRTGAFQYDAVVIDEKSMKRKLPPHARGSYLYLAISETGTVPEDIETYRKVSFSSNTRHELHFAPVNFNKQANLYVRYSDRRGREGPVGPTVSFIIF